ncbi:MAG: DegT/DnrJ/EryC1/StrS family aminotransferase [Spirochaetota bacterium]
MAIPFLDLTRQYRDIRDEVEDAVLRVMEGGVYIGGEEVDRFEEEAARYASVGHGVSLSSGTDALLACLMSLDVGRGDEVVTTPFTFIATAEVISLLGARPVFVDIEEDTFNLDPARLEEAVTERTKCIIPVHLFGHMADMDRIMEVAGRRGIPVIEDAAQAVGAAAGGRPACSVGTAGCLSFFPSKNLGAFGDGGMVLTRDGDFAASVRMIKNHGSEQRYRHSRVGINGRLDALQAAVLRVKLRRLDGWMRRRQENARYYDQELAGLVRTPPVREGYQHVYNQYSILTDRRDQLAAHLKQRGVPSVVYYPLPLHLQPAFASLGYGEGDFPVSERTSGRILSLPVFPELTEQEREAVARGVRSFFG